MAACQYNGIAQAFNDRQKVYLSANQAFQLMATTLVGGVPLALDTYQRSASPAMLMIAMGAGNKNPSKLFAGKTALKPVALDAPQQSTPGTGSGDPLGTTN